MHVVSKARLAEGPGWIEWDDPEGIADIGPQKLRAIRTNPFGAAEDPAMIVGTYGERVIGSLAVLPGSASIGGADVPCLWASGLYVSPEFRQLGMGAMLLLRFQRLHHTVAACGVSQQAYPLYAKLRWLNLEMRRYIFVRRSAALVERYVGGRRSAAVGAAVADSALAVHRVASAVPKRLRLRGLTCEQVEQFPLEMDDLLRRADEPAAFHRSASWVNWVVQNSFQCDPRNRRGLFVVRAAGECVAYFLITSKFHESASRRGLRNLLLGSLQDWLIFDRSKIDVEQIILLALRELANWDVAAVEVCLAEGDHSRSLWRWGFRRVEGLHLLVKAGPASPFRDERLLTPTAWRVRPADGDNAF